jgi:pimeloyl-ACP methyl ester carboxylesterase
MGTATSADGTSIYYEAVGEGPDIVLVHGLTDSHGTWGAIIADLASDHRVTLLDLRGHGQSGDASDYGALGMAGDVAAVVAAAGVDKPLVIGHSLGGVVVSAYAALAPVRGTINVDQSLRLAQFQSALREVEPMLRDPATFPMVLAAIFAGLDGTVLSDELRADIAANRRPEQAVVLGVWDAVLTSPAADLDAQMAQVGGAITAPYLSLQFEDMGADYGDWLRGLVPHAVVEEWPGQGHYGHLIEPERFTARVRAFDGRH